MYVLFDPAAVPALLPGGAGQYKELGDWVTATYAEATRGNIWVYDDNIDGDPRVRVYVDEQPETRLARIAQSHLHDSLLRVPSGRIFCMGGEYVANVKQPHATPATYQPRQPYLGSEASIPPGTYRLSAFELDWERGDVENKIRQQMGEENAVIFDRDGDRIGLGCLATAGGGVLAVVMGFTAYNSGSWQNFWVTLRVLVMLLVPIWWWIARRGQSEEVKRAFERHDIALADWPGIVIVLERLEEDNLPDQFAAARMGPNARLRNQDPNQKPAHPSEILRETLGCIGYYTGIAIVCLILIILGMFGWFFLAR